MPLIQFKQITPYPLKNNKNITPKNLKRFFRCILCIFCLDFGFVDYKSQRSEITRKSLLVFGSVTISVTCIAMIYSNKIEDKFIVWYIKYILESVVNVVILTFTPTSRSFCTFLKHLYFIDSKLGVDSNSYRLDIKIITFCVLASLVKLIASTFYCIFFYDCLGAVYVNLVFFIPYVSFDYPLIMFFFVFYSSNSRLIVMRKLLEKKKFQPKYFLRLYMTLIDCTENMKNTFDPIFLGSLFTNIPAIMFVIYHNVKEIKYDMKNPGRYTLSGVSIVISVAIIFAPAVSATLLSSGAEKIKIILHNNLLHEKDRYKSQDLQRFINYIKARPFKFHVFSVIPMDATLPVKIFNLCITYLIITMQITHLY